MPSAVGVKTLEVAHHCPLEGHTLESHDLDRHGAGGNVQDTSTDSEGQKAGINDCSVWLWGFCFLVCFM